jgi:phosphoribosylformylglycinamidine synthase
VHDVSDGGLAVTLAEMAAAGGVGVRVGRTAVPDITALFGEGPSRAVVCVARDRVPDVVLAGQRSGVAVTELGTAGGDGFVVDGLVDLGLHEVTAAWRDRLPVALGRGTTQG